MNQSFTLLRLMLVATVALLVLTASSHAHAQESHWCMQQQSSDWSRSLKRLSAVEITDPYIARSMRLELERGLDELRGSYDNREKEGTMEGPSPVEVCAPFFHELIAVARIGEVIVADDAEYERSLRGADEACGNVQSQAFHSTAMCPVIMTLNDAESGDKSDSAIAGALGRCASDIPRRQWRWVWAGLCIKMQRFTNSKGIREVGKKIRSTRSSSLRQLVALVDEALELCGREGSRGIQEECRKETFEATEDVLAHHLASEERRTPRTFDGYQAVCSKLVSLGSSLPSTVRPDSDKCTPQMHEAYKKEALRECRRDRDCRNRVYAVAEASPILQASQDTTPVGPFETVEQPPSAADLHRRRQLRIATGILWSLTAVTVAGGVYLTTQVLDDQSGKYYLRVRDSAVPLGFPGLGDDPCALSYTNQVSMAA